MNTEMIKKAMQPVAKIASKTVLKAREASPEIFFGCGVLGVIGCVVLAVRASRKADEVAAECRETLENIASDDISDGEKRVEIVKTVARTGFKYARVYGPAALAGIGGLVCFGASHKVLKGRYADLKQDFENLGKAYSALDIAYKGLRKRIREKYGEDVENELVFGDGSIGIKESYVDPETGRKKTKMTPHRKFDEQVPKSPYTFIFSRDTVLFNKWSQDPEVNRMFLEHMEAMANDLLFRRGYVFLYEILQDIDLRDTPESHVLGWVYDEKRSDLANHIDFGFMEGYREAYRLDSDLCKEIRLDFNCDGNIISGVNCYTNYRKD